MDHQGTAVEFSNVTKAFGQFIANKNLNFSIAKGTIKALLGENGAGKSTAMKILYGIHEPTSGDLLINGKKVHFKSPKDAVKAGIGMVHQHFMLTESLTVLDNIIIADNDVLYKNFLNRHFFKLINRKKALEKIKSICDQYRIELPLNSFVKECPLGIRQKIEIVKLLYKNSEILILDEPTAVLTPPEADDLFEGLKILKQLGKTIVVVTHKLQEVFNHTDDITILRNGEISGELLTKEANEEAITQLMIGRSINSNQYKITSPKTGKVILKIDNLSIKPKNSIIKKEKAILNHISFSVKEHEIVGIAGVEGNGQSELLNYLFTPEKYRKGNFKIEGNIEFLHKDHALLNSQDLQKLSAGFIPEDRHASGLILNFNLLENFLLGQQRSKKFAKYGFLKFNSLLNALKEKMDSFDIRPRNPSLTTKLLSGGNQQKLILSREMNKNPKLIIAAHPTRGVDIGAIEFIHSELLKYKLAGSALLIISSELDELLKLCDRIIVMYEGSSVTEFMRNDFNEQEIGKVMCRGQKS